MQEDIGEGGVTSRCHTGEEVQQQGEAEPPQQWQGEAGRLEGSVTSAIHLPVGLQGRDSPAPTHDFFVFQAMGKDLMML